MNSLLLKKNGKTICWKKLTQEDWPEVAKLLEEYCGSEPLAVVLNSSDFNQSSIEKAKSVFEENLSIGAYDLDVKDHLCSICLVGVYDPANFVKDIQEMNEQFHPAQTIIPRLIMETLEGIEEITRGERFLWHYFASTLPNYRRMGITTELQKKMETVAIEQNCHFIAGVYSSEFTKRASKNVGYKCYKEIAYADYTDPLTKQQPFKEVQFHVSIKSMYLELKMQ